MRTPPFGLGSSYQIWPPTVGSKSHMKPAITGTTINLIVTECPPIGVAAVVLGLTKFNPGIPLAILGMPGCLAHTTPDLIVAGLPLGTTFQTPLPIPLNPSLTGFQLLGQGLALSASIPNPFQGITSNGLDLVVGTL